MALVCSSFPGLRELVSIDRTSFLLACRCTPAVPAYTAESCIIYAIETSVLHKSVVRLGARRTASLATLNIQDLRSRRFSAFGRAVLDVVGVRFFRARRGKTAHKWS